MHQEKTAQKHITTIITKSITPHSPFAALLPSLVSRWISSQVQLPLCDGEK
jgi:hypothetical protein